MLEVTAYLNCGCAILEGGSRRWCPTCEGQMETSAPWQEMETSAPWQEIVVLVPGDGSEHLDYIRKNMEHIPDFMWHSVVQVMQMAEMWIKAQP